MDFVFEGSALTFLEGDKVEVDEDDARFDIVWWCIVDDGSKNESGLVLASRCTR